MQIKKTIKVLTAAVAAIVLAITNVCAMNYGEEWKNYSSPNNVIYKDVSPNYWAYNSIVKVSQKNWFNGYPDGTFRPEDFITRAEAITVFVKFLGLELKQVSESSFYDVNPNEWYAPYIEAGKDLFPTHTTIQGKKPFQPDMPVTREDTVYALVKALGCDQDATFVDESILNMFHDKDSISDNVRKQFAVALNHGLVSGYPEGIICAQSPLARSEFATLLVRGTEHGFHNYSAKIDHVSLNSEDKTLEIGEEFSLKAQAVYTDGTIKDFTTLDAYCAENNDVVEIKNNTVVAKKQGTCTIGFTNEYLKNQKISVTVKNPSDAPILKITDYPDETKETMVIISGTVSDKNGNIDLTCNGKDIEADGNGRFSIEVTLKEGSNKFEFVAKNKYGNQSEKSIVIEHVQEKITEKQSLEEQPSEEKSSEYEVIKCDCFGVVPDFDYYFGEEPYYGCFFPDESRYVFSYDSWNMSKDEVKKILEKYFSSLKKAGFSYVNSLDKNKAEEYNFSNANGSSVQVGNDYSLGHISIRVTLAEKDRELWFPHNWRYGNNYIYDKD